MLFAVLDGTHYQISQKVAAMAESFMIESSNENSTPISLSLANIFWHFRYENDLLNVFTGNFSESPLDIFSLLCIKIRRNDFCLKNVVFPKYTGVSKIEILTFVLP